MRINIEDAKPGMICEKPILNERNVVIINSGTVLTQNLINGLYKNYIFTLDVKGEELEQKKEADIYTTISNELKQKSIESLKQLDIVEIISNATEIVNAILNSKDFSYSLLEYKLENDIYSHSVRVAAFASVLAKYYNQTAKETEKINLQNLSIAALVHDLGKTLKENNVKISIGNLTSVLKEKLPGVLDAPLIGYDDNFEALYTFCLLNQFPNLNTEIKMSVLLSTENEMETGPLKAQKKLMTSKQSFITSAKIIRLCSIYDDILKQTIDKNESLENISAQLETYSVNGILSKELTDLFIKHVPLYSVGIKVHLSDGRTAQVIETFTEKVNNYKPKVKVLKTGEIIDLREITNLTVVDIDDDNISFEEIVTRQIIDMNNEITNIEQKRRR